MSVLTIIWIILLIYAMSRNNNLLIFLTMLSSLLQSATFMKVGGSEVSYFMITTLMLFVKVVLNGRRVKIRKWGKIFLVFFVWAVFVGLLAPLIFPDVEALYLLDGNFLKEPIYRIGFPFMKYVNVLVMIVATICIINITVDKSTIIKAFILVNVIVCTIALVHFFSIIFNLSGVFNLLADSIYNSRSAEMYGSFSSTYYSFTTSNRPRAIGTFLEASYFGAYLSSTIWAEVYFVTQNDYMKSRKKWFMILIAINIVMLVLNMSSTGLATFALGGILFFIFIFGRKKLSMISCGVVALVVLLLNIDWITHLELYNDIYTMLFQKIGTNSEVVRTRWTTEAWRVINETLGFGVGIQRTRAGNLIVNLIVQTGFLGAFIFVFYYLNLVIKNFKNRINPICGVSFMYSIVLLVAQMVSCPHIDFAPFIFGLLMLSIGYESAKQNESDKIRKGNFKHGKSMRSNSHFQQKGIFMSAIKCFR